MSQKLVTVRSKTHGLVSNLVNNRLYVRRKCHLTNGIADIRQKIPLKVWIPNFSDKPQHLPKHMSVLIVAPAPEIIFHEQDNNQSIEIEDVNVIRLKGDFDANAERRNKVVEADKQNIESDWRNVINVGESYKNYKSELIQRLEKYEEMWDGHLGTVNTSDT